MTKKVLKNIYLWLGLSNHLSLYIHSSKRKGFKDKSNRLKPVVLTLLRTINMSKSLKILDYFFEFQKKWKLSIIWVLLGFLWVGYYSLNSFYEKTNYFYTYNLLKNENSYFFLGILAWNFNEYFSWKIYKLLRPLKKVNIIKMICLFFFYIFIFVFFSGLFLGHNNHIYFIDFSHYFYDDVIFLVVSIILYSFYHNS